METCTTALNLALVLTSKDVTHLVTEINQRNNNNKASILDFSAHTSCTRPRNTSRKKACHLRTIAHVDEIEKWVLAQQCCGAVAQGAQNPDEAFHSPPYELPIQGGSYFCNLHLPFRLRFLYRVVHIDAICPYRVCTYKCNLCLNSTSPKG